MAANSSCSVNETLHLSWFDLWVVIRVVIEVTICTCFFLCTEVYNMIPSLCIVTSRNRRQLFISTSLLNLL